MTQKQESITDEKQSARKTILVVEDDIEMAAFLALAITQETSYHPLMVQNSVAAMDVIKSIKPNLVILDYYLPHMNGIALYEQLHAIDELAAIPAIMMSASLEKHQAEIDRHQLVGIAKPLELDDFLASIEKALAI